MGYNRTVSEACAVLEWINDESLGTRISRL